MLREQLPIHDRIGVECGVEARQLLEQLALPLSTGRAFCRKDAIPIRGGGEFRVVVQFLTVMHTEENEHQCRAQFTRGDVNFAAQVAGLQRIGQSSTQTRAALGIAQCQHRRTRTAPMLCRT